MLLNNKYDTNFYASKVQQIKSADVTLAGFKQQFTRAKVNPAKFEFVRHALVRYEQPRTIEPRIMTRVSPPRQARASYDDEEVQQASFDQGTPSQLPDSPIKSNRRI